MIKKIFYLFLFLLIISLLYSGFILFSDFFEKDIFRAKKIIYNRYSRSHQYIINNNVAQYSSYLTKYDEIYIIDIYFSMNSEYIENATDFQKYLCILKWVDVSKLRENLIELEAKSSSQYYFMSNKRIRFELNRKDLLIYENFKIENVFVGIIRKDEYDKNLNESMLNNALSSVDTKLFNKIVLPYSLINYQKPTIFNGNKNLSKTVSLCIPYSYGETISHLEDALKMNLRYGFAEIMLYDSTSTQQMKNLFEKDKYKNDKRLKFKPYRIKKDDICSNVSLAKSVFTKIGELLKTNCYEFFKQEFENYEGGRQKHEQITSNDCITIMKNSHEFIAYYDLDEFVFPRTFGMDSKPSLKIDCSKNIRNYNINAFEFNKNGNETSFIYNYLDSLIEKNINGRDKKMLSTISFEHAAYIDSNSLTDELFQDLGEIIKANNTSSNNFPITIFLDKQKKLHKFLIEENDFDHVKHLYDSFNSVKSCSFRNLNSSLNALFQRYIYFLTESEQRWPKCIYYSKNVNSVFVHYPTDVSEGSWSFTPSRKDGDFLSHFRSDMLFFDIKYNMSILKLNIDLEYFLSNYKI